MLIIICLLLLLFYRCSDIININISNNLTHITTIKGLTIIRDSVHQLLSEVIINLLVLLLLLLLL